MFPQFLDLLGQVPAVQQGQIESVLFRLAADKAPAPPTREKWQAWWKDNQAAVNMDRLKDTTALLGFTVLLLAGMGMMVSATADPVGMAAR